jgi:tetratricopeptide (TPR) repeat protein
MLQRSLGADQPRRLVGTEGELALQLQGRDAIGVGSHQISGERESGTARLEEAVAAYRAALEERTCERAPLDWATMQNNLGNALQTLGEQESGTARLEEAVAAYRAALQERTRDRVPRGWAITQYNLGNALQRLEEGESSIGTALSTLEEQENRTGRLKEAVAAYRAALQEETCEREPATLGEHENKTAQLKEALAAYRAALREGTRGLEPATLGEQENRTARSKEAMAAYRAALREWLHGLDPAMPGQRESGAARLEEAVAAYRAALQEWTRERDPFDWAQTQKNLRHRAQEARGTGKRDGAAGGGVGGLPRVPDRRHDYLARPGFIRRALTQGRDVGRNQAANGKIARGAEVKNFEPSESPLKNGRF